MAPSNFQPTMKSVTKIQTCDGVIHADERAARRHLDKAYSDALFKLVTFLRKGECDVANHAITGDPSAFMSGESRARGRAVEFLDKNMSELHDLVTNAQAFKQDMKMEESSCE